MQRDKQLIKLLEAWNAIDTKESLVSRAPIEGAIAVEAKIPLANPLNIDKLKNSLIIEDGDTDITIRLGWKTLATIEEEDGKWFPTIDGKEILSLGYDTKQQAIDKIIEYFVKE